MTAMRSLDDTTIVLTRMLDEYRVWKPEIVNASIIPSETETELSKAWDVTHPARPVSFHRLRNVYVTAEGLVFDQDLTLIEDTLTQHEPAAVLAGEAELRAAILAGFVSDRPGTTLLGGKIGMSNYGHWMVEMLPLSFMSLPWLETGEWSVLLPRLYPWMRDVILSSLDLIGVPQTSIIPGLEAPQRYEELVVVPNLSVHGRHYPALAIEAMSKMAAAVPAGRAEKIWISRVGELRTLAEEAELCERLVQLGWLIVDPRQTSLAGQIAAAKGCRLMAGVNGAGLTNLGFMNPGAQVVSFIPCNMPDVFYFSLAAHRRVHFIEYRCPVIPAPDWHIQWDGILQISVDDAVTFLEQRYAN